MWVKKTAEELAVHRFREIRGRFLWAFCIAMFLSLMGFELLTSSRYWHTYLPFICLMISILTGLLYGLYGPDRDGDSWICMTCQKQVPAGEERRCACGMEYVDAAECARV